MAASDIVLHQLSIEFSSESEHHATKQIELCWLDAVGGVFGKKRVALEHRKPHPTGQLDNLAVGSAGSYPGGVWLPGNTWLEGTATEPLVIVGTQLGKDGQAQAEVAELNAARLIDVLNGTRLAVAQLRVRVEELETSNELLKHQLSLIKGKP